MANRTALEECRKLWHQLGDALKRSLKYCGTDASLMTRRTEFEDESRRLEKIYAEERRKAEIIKEVLEERV